MSASPWSPTAIKRVMNVVVSSTCPAMVHTDAGAAYAKALGNPSGPHALACELVGTRLATWLGLPTFDLALVDYPGRPTIEYPNGTTAQAGTALLARLVPGTTWGDDPDGLKLVSNPETIAGLVVFDTWTRNKDRYYPHRIPVRKNLGNVFLTEDGAPARRFRLLAIDHTECFREAGELPRNLCNIDRVKDRAVHGLFDEFVPHVTMASAAKFVGRLTELRRDDVTEIVESIPGDWSVNKQLRRILRDFICDRAAFLGGTLMDVLGDACAWQRNLFN